MSTLFTPHRIGPVEVPNRFVRSATFEQLATPEGRVTDELVRVYRTLAQGEVGLIIVSLASVHTSGTAYRKQLSLGSDEAVPDLRRLVDAVREHGESKVFVQLMHAGRQGDPAVIGRRPGGPSAAVIDPNYFYRPRELGDGEIEAIIGHFVRATERCRAAGVDGVQLHAAHTYLINQFLSPYLNRRTDRWGGTDEGRFRLLREIVRRTRAAVGSELAIAVKLNSCDHTPRPGVTPELAARYAGWLAEEGIDAIEVSAGSTHFAIFNMSRGTVPTAGFVRAVPPWMRPAAWLIFKLREGRFEHEEGYNLAAARRIKAAVGSTPVILVGGLRSRARMEAALASGTMDFVSMSRPFLREPRLVRRLRLGETDSSACASCNNCLAAVVNKLPARCYVKGIPGVTR